MAVTVEDEIRLVSQALILSLDCGMETSHRKVYLALNDGRTENKEWPARQYILKSKGCCACKWLGCGGAVLRPSGLSK